MVFARGNRLLVALDKVVDGKGVLAAGTSLRRKDLKDARGPSAACTATQRSSFVRLCLHQDLAGCRPVIEHRSPGTSPPHEAGVEQHLEMAAH
jgi:hypothetical protein